MLQTGRFDVLPKPKVAGSSPVVRFTKDLRTQTFLLLGARGVASGNCCGQRCGAPPVAAFASQTQFRSMTGVLSVLMVFVGVLGLNLGIIWPRVTTPGMASLPAGVRVAPEPIGSP